MGPLSLLPRTQPFHSVHTFETKSFVVYSGFPPIMSVPNHNEIWRRGAEEFRGQRLLPHVVDYHAHENPNRVFNSMPRTQNVADGFRDFDMKTMATAVDFMAWWLDNHSKNAPKEKKVLAYVGVPDIRYPVLLFAAIKAGWTVENPKFLPRPGISADIVIC